MTISDADLEAIRAKADRAPRAARIDVRVVIDLSKSLLVAIEALDHLSKRSTYYGDDVTSCEAALATAREALAKIRGDK